MIIVNQAKDAIINFDNMNEIMATKTGKILLFDNTYRSQDDCSDVLGKYKTEERAKEILQEIIEFYEISRTYESKNGVIVFHKLLLWHFINKFIVSKYNYPQLTR